jgi:hypothetical protein
MLTFFCLQENMMPPKTRIQKLAESLTSKATKAAGRSNATKSYSGIKPEDLDKETPEMLEQRRIALKRARDFV